MIITSLDNAKLVACRKLADKKYRRKEGRYVVEGERLVADAIRHGAKVTNIFVKESVADKFATSYPDADVVADRAFDTLCDTVTTQGIVAVVEQAELPLAAPCGNSLVLDGLQDPGNVGTLIRTAAACGFTDVYAVGSVDLYSPKVLRSAMSAHFCVKLHQSDDIEAVFAVLDGVMKVCADMGGKNVFDVKFDGKVALIVGNEGNGISDFTRRNADITVALPMANDFESLNASVAGSVVMYQIFAGKGN